MQHKCKNQKRPIGIYGLTVTYNNRPILYNINCEIPKGKMIGLIGPNGGGKSTFIKCIMGLIKIDDGSISIFGNSVKKSIMRISYVPQRESVDWDFPINVYDVVMMGRYGYMGIGRRPKQQDHIIVKASLKRVNLLSLQKRQISQLSGGQQQRVFLARALAQNSDLYLMDEPFAGIDVATESAIIAVLQELKNKGKTILIVHHDLTTARQYFDMLMLLNIRLIAFGSTSQIFTYPLLQKTYEGKLGILSEITNFISKNEKF